MPDYQEMYLTLMCAAEDAIQTLIAAQQKCEELYINSPETVRDFQIISSEKTREK